MSAALLLLEAAPSAHMGRNPINQTGDVGGLTSPNHAGYGYLARSSEAEADNAVDFSCSATDRQGYVRGACHAAEGTTYPAPQLQSLSKQFASGQTLQNLRDKIYEYVALQYAATDNLCSAGETRPAPGCPPPAARPMGIKRPACVSTPATPADDPASSLIGNQVPDETYVMVETAQLNQMPETTPEQRAAKEKARRTRDLDLKYMAVSNSFTTDNMVQAVALDEQLRFAQHQNNCENVANNPGQTADQNEINRRLLCVDVRDQLDRLRSSYPEIFLGNTAAYYNASPSDQAAENARMDSIRKAAYDVIGANGRPSAMTDPAQITARGTAMWNPRVKSAASDAMQNLTTDYESGSQGARNGFCMAGPGQSVTVPYDGFNCATTVQHDPVVDAAFQNLQQQTAQIRAQYRARLQKQLDGVCGNPAPSLAQLAKKYPSVLRQLLLDQSGPELQATKAAVCADPKLAEQLKQGVRDSCLGISGSLTSPTGVRVHRNMSAFPFSSSPNYTVKQNPDGSLTVKLDMNFTSDGTPPIPPAQYQALVNGWASSTASQYNTQSGSPPMTPPLDPKINFQINAVQGSADPHVIVSQCYNRDPAIADAIRRNCTALAALPPPPNGPGNWQDAGGLTTDTNQQTLTHEFGHNMGLEDEYQALYYPINTLGESGEHGSVMNNGDQLQRRHFEQIVRSARQCGTPPAGGGT